MAQNARPFLQPVIERVLLWIHLSINLMHEPRRVSRPAVPNFFDAYVSILSVLLLFSEAEKATD